MAVLNWGDLTKNSEDSETIEQAIARLIAQHNDDQESHLAAGQSLQSHKGAAIIDHLANSVVRDKLAFDRFAIDELFATLDPWQINAYVESMGYGDVLLMVGPTINQRAIMSLTEGEGIENQCKINLDPVWQIRLKINSNTNQLIHIGPIAPDALAGYGYRITDGNIYAVFYNSEEEMHQYISTIPAVNLFITFECYVTNGDTIHWKINGTEYHSQVAYDIVESTEFMAIYFKNTAAETKGMHVQAFHYDADYIA